MFYSQKGKTLQKTFMHCFQKPKTLGATFKFCCEKPKTFRVAESLKLAKQHSSFVFKSLTFRNNIEVVVLKV